MKLYDDARAPSPRRVRMFAAEKGLELPRIAVDIAGGGTQAEDFRRINPLGEVPVLELDDGTRLTESLAICRYLESIAPQPNLLGRNPREAADIESAVLQLMFRAYVPTTQAFRHTHKFWAGRIAQVPEYGALARESVLAEWARLDQLLAHREYLAGDRFTFADIVGFTTLDFGKPAGIRLQPGQVALARWHAAVAARPSAAA
jgi:glutathione S-transferase